MVMHSFVPCCKTAQPLLFDSSAFRHSGFVLFPLFFFSPLCLKRLILPADAPGGGDWAIVHELFLYLQLRLTAQDWGVVCQFCEHSLFHPHFILPQGGMCWQEMSLYICINIFVICVSWSLVLGLGGVYVWNTLLQICSPSGLSVFKDCSILFSSWVL